MHCPKAVRRTDLRTMRSRLLSVIQIESELRGRYGFQRSLQAGSGRRQPIIGPACGRRVHPYRPLPWYLEADDSHRGTGAARLARREVCGLGPVVYRFARRLSAPTAGLREVSSIIAASDRSISHGVWITQVPPCDHLHPSSHLRGRDTRTPRRSPVAGQSRCAQGR
jgi:hypothetical protein